MKYIYICHEDNQFYFRLENEKIEALLGLQATIILRKIIKSKPKQLYVTLNDIKNSFVNVCY